MPILLTAGVTAIIVILIVTDMIHYNRLLSFLFSNGVPAHTKLTSK